LKTSKNLEDTLHSVYTWFQGRVALLELHNQTSYKNALKEEFMEWDDESIKTHDVFSFSLEE
jgi:hypothetical protein